MLIKLYILVLEYMIFYLVNLKISPQLVNQDLLFVAKIRCIDEYLKKKKAKKIQIDLRPTCIAYKEISQKNIKDISSGDKIHFKIYDMIEDELFFMLINFFKFNFWRNIFVAANIIASNIEKDIDRINLIKKIKKYHN